MKNDSFNPQKNYEESQQKVGYIARKNATQADYDRIGFMSGLEVHQQLLTKVKLFCRCPAGKFHADEDYDAEVIRHMRPTLSELGEYDGTALMEFRTRKEIVYRVKHETTCTYEVDDTPPFHVDNTAVEISILISLLSKLNIVGEIHVTRKQYLDGSIPTGFQRTAIIGVEGVIQLKHKKIRLIQLSLEEDSCREISDIGHTRIYKTDRLGMPLIETVTYPDMVNPDEVQEACDYIRFLNRSTGLVRTGIGAGRQDVNVSCRGGSRVEIKGVAHTKWIPELTHVECFRQWALLQIKNLLNENIPDTENWKMNHKELTIHNFDYPCDNIKDTQKNNHKIIGINLPGFEGALSYYTQPKQSFADEFSQRLKVIACIEHPNMIHSETLDHTLAGEDLNRIRSILDAKEGDAQIIFWGPEDDIETALVVIEERCQMAFEGVPEETRKSFQDGSTIFERVLPGADRMYPDTDTAPIPLKDSYIEDLRKQIPNDIVDRYNQMVEWKIPEDTYTYIFSKNLYPLIEKIVNKLNIDAKFVGTFMGHTLKFVQGHYVSAGEFNYDRVFDLFKFLKENEIELNIAKEMLQHVFEHPKMDFDSILTIMKFKKLQKDEILSKVPFLVDKFNEIKISDKEQDKANWIMGQLHRTSIGNINLTELASSIK